MEKKGLRSIFQLNSTIEQISTAETISKFCKVWNILRNLIVKREFKLVNTIEVTKKVTGIDMTKETQKQL